MALATLKRNPTFSRLSEAELTELAKKVTVIELRHEDVLFSPGELAESVFFVQKGNIQLLLEPNSKAAEGTDSLILRKLFPGELVGLSSLIHRREYDFFAVAEGDSTVLKLSREEFDGIAKSPRLKSRVTNYTKLTKANHLRKIPLLRNVDAKTLSIVTELLKTEYAPPGTILLKEGAYSEKCYFVVEGSILATILDKYGFPKYLTTFQEGQLFGERNIQNQEPCVCTVVTTQVTELFSLKREDFSRFLGHLPDVNKLLNRQKKLIGHVQEVLNANPILKNLSQRTKKLLEYAVKGHKYREGRVILEPSKEPKDHMLYLIVSGSVTVRLPGEMKPLKTLKRGDFFGEIRLITGGATTAEIAVTESEPLRCLVVPQESFFSIFNLEPALISEICIRILGKETPLSFLLQHPVTRDSFLKHCESEFSQENIEFWLRCTELKDLNRIDVSPALLKPLKLNTEEQQNKKKLLIEKKCREIFEEYVKEYSPSEINIDGITRASIIQRMNENDMSADMFDRAKQIIINLMESDIYPRYVSSPLFAAALSKFKLYKRVERATRIEIMGSEGWKKLDASD